MVPYLVLCLLLCFHIAPLINAVNIFFSYLCTTIIFYMLLDQLFANSGSESMLNLQKMYPQTLIKLYLALFYFLFLLYKVISICKPATEMSKCILTQICFIFCLLIYLFIYFSKHVIKLDVSQHNSICKN